MASSDHKSDFLIGALIGGIAAGAAGLLFAPKAGKELREDMVDQYNRANTKKNDFKECIKEKGKCIRGYFSREEEEDACCSKALFIGGLTGILLGATSALLFAPRSGDKLRTLLGDKYEEACDRSEELASCLQGKGKEAFDRLDGWKDALITVVDKISAGTSSKGKKRTSSTAETLADWAEFGLHMFHQLQNRR